MLQSEPRELRLLRNPTIYGDNVVFGHASRLWIGNRRTGTAKRLTTKDGDERLAKFSRDGQSIAYTANYDGSPDIYIVPMAGGEPRRVTFDPYRENISGWTADGKIAYNSAAGAYVSSQSPLWLVDPTGGLPYSTPLQEFDNGSFFNDGKRIAYNRGWAYSQNWRRYRGGLHGRISIYDFSRDAYSELPSGPENNWYPMAVGESIYYASDRADGTLNLYRYDFAGKRDTRLTFHRDADIRTPSTDGHTIVYDKLGELYTYDIATAAEAKLRFVTDEVSTASQKRERKVGSELANPAIDGDGSRLAFDAHGEIFTITSAGDPVNETRTAGVREMQPLWAPDGSSLAFLSDASGEFQVVAKAAGGPAMPLTKHTGSGITGFNWAPDSQHISYWTHDQRLFIGGANMPEREVYQCRYQAPILHAWSPDSKWIAYIQPGANTFGVIHLYEVSSGKDFAVTSGKFDDQNPCFDKTGKYLYFTSPRSFSPITGRYENSIAFEKADRVYVVPLAADLPNPLLQAPHGERNNVVDVDGFEAREIVLPMQRSRSGALLPSSDGVFWYSDGKLHHFSLADQKDEVIIGAPDEDTGLNLAISGDEKKVVYSANETFGVVEAKPGQKFGDGKVDVSKASTDVVPSEEWRQMFWDAWRVERDEFYRPDMGGVDWQGMGRKYAGLLPYADDRSDLTFLLGQLIGELGTSHSVAISPPSAPVVPKEKAQRPALLGVDYSRDGKWVRLKRIYRGSLADESLRAPLGEIGVHVRDGEYLLEIDGNPVSTEVDPGALLINKANKPVEITVNTKPTVEGARKYKVRPLATDTAIRYYQWVEDNRRKVAELSGNRIAYIHYPSTSTRGQIEFIKGFYSSVDKDAVILDDRFNGGGDPQPMVIPTLGRRWQTNVRARNWESYPEIAAINGPKALLINEYAGSGGDLTAFMFRDAKLGALVGKRTMGALVGIAIDSNLLDGGTVRIPGYTRFSPITGEWIAENHGIEPNVDVDNRPDLLANGHDLQLETAVKLLLAQLDAKKNAKQPAPSWAKTMPWGGNKG